jgi:predicted ribosome quality control (RQC) complex YloA/Tae2 family protein
MELSGVELNYLLNEIKSNIVQGYYVSDVTPVTRDSFLFKLHHSTEPDIMLMVSTKGIWVTKLKFKPLEQNSLGEVIKSHLERSKIDTLHQPGTERIVIFNFKHPTRGLRILVVELFADGNIVLCDEKSNILAILNPIEAKHRTLRVGTVYEFPPRRGIDVLNISMDDLVSMRNNIESTDLQVVKWVGRITSLPRKFVEEIVRKSNVETETVKNLNLDELRRIYYNTRSLVEEIITRSKHSPFLIEDEDGNPTDVFPIPTSAAATPRTRKVADYMEAVDQVLSYQIINLGQRLKTNHIESRLSSLLHDISEQDKAKEKVIANAHVMRKVARELMSIPYEGQDIELYEPITKLIQEKLVNVFNHKGTRYLGVAGEDIEFQRNPARMSSMLFQRAKDLERGISSIDEARSRLMAHVDKLRKQADSIESKGPAVRYVRNKEWYERYRWFVTSDGLLAIGGRDASSNSAIIRKHLGEQDLVFHAEIHGSPFFILKNGHSLDNIGPSLLEVGQATVSFSRAWKDGLYGSDAYWVTPAQVRRGAPTGQFLPKGSFVIEGKRNFVKGLEIQLAIGIVKQKEQFFLCCGPVQAIKTRSLVYASLLPGGHDPINAAKKVRNEFVSVLAERTKPIELSLSQFVKSMSIDDYVRALPTGQSRITSLIHEGLDKGIDSLEESKRNDPVEQSN